jgi:sugar O-acyltransferase (sialic acid O-acetyltransferase NeuD family)
MKRPVILLGAGGHARVVLDALRATGREVKGILTPESPLWGQDLSGVPILGGDDRVRDYSADDIEIVNGVGSVGDPSARIKIYRDMKKKGFSFAIVIHPSAIIPDNIFIGEGVQVMAGAVIQTGCRVGENVIVNTGVVIDHDCRIADHVHLATGVVLSGGVVIGPTTHVGTGACVVQGIKIGGSVMVAAGAIVVDDIPEGAHVRGVPARVVT